MDAWQNKWGDKLTEYANKLKKHKEEDKLQRELYREKLKKWEESKKETRYLRIVTTQNEEFKFYETEHNINEIETKLDNVLVV
jgi:hypothetical protein